MKPTNKVVIMCLALLICFYMLWTQRAVTIIMAGSQIEYDPHFVLKPFTSRDKRFETYGIVVNHFPLTEWGKIHWYLNHKKELQKKYGIPSSRSYMITFWDIGSGFTDFKSSGNSDLYCFSRKNEPDKHCIEKHMFMEVNFDAGLYETFSFRNNDYYWITMSDGKLQRIKRA